jgi:GNAT superfamily N-acetyltransferase
MAGPNHATEPRPQRPSEAELWRRSLARTKGRARLPGLELTARVARLHGEEQRTGGRARVLLPGGRVIRRPRAMKGIEPRDGQRAIDTIVLAFAADPVERWMYPRPGDYLRDFRAFVEAFAGPALADRTAWMLDDFAAVALWLAPGREPESETIVSVLTDSVAADQQDDLLVVLEQMDTTHPTSAHWYLPWLAVDPARQRDGLGGRLLDSACAGSTSMACLPIWRRPIRRPSPSANAAASRSPGRLAAANVHRSPACCDPPPPPDSRRSSRPSALAA